MGAPDDAGPRGGGAVEVLSLPDLAASKKTQRDKDWPMLRRLVEVNYLTHRDQATDPRVGAVSGRISRPICTTKRARMAPSRIPARKGSRDL